MVQSRWPNYYPANYADQIAAKAGQEREVVIYSNIDAEPSAKLNDDFQRMYPRVDVTDPNVNSTKL